MAPLWKDALVAVARGDSPVATRPSSTPADLIATTILLVGNPASTCKPGEPLVSVSRHPLVEYVANVDVLLTLVGAGRGTGLISAAQAETIQWTELRVRPIESPAAEVQTLLLRRKADQSTLVTRFEERAVKSLKAKSR